jgi:hypothetical protein
MSSSYPVHKGDPLLPNTDGDVGVALAAGQRVVLFHKVSGLTHEDLEDALSRNGTKFYHLCFAKKKLMVM